MIGYADGVTENGIYGWAHDPTRADEPTMVLLVIHDQVVATVRADSFRQDLKDAGYGDGRRAFWVNPSPWLTCDNEAVRIAFASTGETVPNGRALLSLSKVDRSTDWDRFFPQPEPPLPAIDRIQSFPPSSWPLISVIMPVYNPPVEFLELAIKSVLGQTYPRWELCLADDASTDPSVHGYLAQCHQQDPRIKVVFCERNGGISRSTNAAFAMSSGDFFALLDHDDELTPDALAEVAAHLLEHPETDVVFTDQDKCDEKSQPFEPFHKPCWSPVFFLGVMYVGHLLVARATLIRQVNGCDSQHDKVQDYELMLRLSEVTNQIAHLPVIAYHWRALAGSLASSTHAKSRIEELQVAAVQSHLDRRGLGLKAVSHPVLPHRVQLLPACDHAGTKVSIIIPTKDCPDMIERCLNSIFQATTHRNFEVLVVDTGTTDERALAAMRHHPVTILEDRQTFSFSRVNNIAARAATGEVLVFLNNDTEVVTPDWLQILLAHLALPGVGAVGPQLLYPNGTIQHAGVVLGFRGTCDHVMRGFRPTDDGYGGSLACSREVSAVTAACLMMRRDTYMQLGGMNEAFGSVYQDVDLCLKIRETGQSILYVANAVLNHHESVSRGTRYDFVDRELLLDRWGEIIGRGDPYYSRYFTLNRHDYSLKANAARST